MYLTSDDKVFIEWGNQTAPLLNSAGESYCDRYVVYRSSYGDGRDLVAIGTTQAEMFLDYNVRPNTVYHYRVFAVTGGSSVNIANFTVTTKSAPELTARIPTTPAGLTAKGTSKGITWSWSSSQDSGGPNSMLGHLVETGDAKQPRGFVWSNGGKSTWNEAVPLKGNRTYRVRGITKKLKLSKPSNIARGKAGGDVGPTPGPTYTPWWFVRFDMLVEQENTIWDPFAETIVPQFSAQVFEGSVFEGSRIFVYQMAVAGSTGGTTWDFTPGVWNSVYAIWEPDTAGSWRQENSSWEGVGIRLFWEGLANGQKCQVTRFRAGWGGTDVKLASTVPCPDYFDGDSPGWEWDGVPHNSTSRKIGAGVYGARNLFVNPRFHLNSDDGWSLNAEGFLRTHLADATEFETAGFYFDPDYMTNMGWTNQYTSATSIGCRKKAPVVASPEWQVKFLIYEHIDSDYIRKDGSTHHVKDSLASSTMSNLERALRGPFLDRLRTVSDGKCVWNIDISRISTPVTHMQQVIDDFGGVDNVPSGDDSFLNSGNYDVVFSYSPAWDNGYFVPGSFIGLTTSNPLGTASTWIADWFHSWDNSQCYDLLIHEFIHGVLAFFGIQDILDQTLDNTTYTNPSHGYSWPSYFGNSADLLAAYLRGANITGPDGTKFGITDADWALPKPKSMMDNGYEFYDTGGVEVPVTPSREWNIKVLIYEHIDSDYIRANGSTGHITASLTSSVKQQITDIYSGLVQARLHTFSEGRCKWNVDMSTISEPITATNNFPAHGRAVNLPEVSSICAPYLTSGEFDIVFNYFPGDIAEDIAGDTFVNPSGPTTIFFPASSNWGSISATDVPLHEFLHQALGFLHVPDILDQMVDWKAYSNPRDGYSWPAYGDPDNAGMHGTADLYMAYMRGATITSPTGEKFGITTDMWLGDKPRHHT